MMIFSAIWIQYTSVTDGQTGTDQQLVPCLCMVEIWGQIYKRS